MQNANKSEYKNQKCTDAINRVYRNAIMKFQKRNTVNCRDAINHVSTIDGCRFYPYTYVYIRIHTFTYDSINDILFNSIFL